MNRLKLTIKLVEMHYIFQFYERNELDNNAKGLELRICKLQ